MQHQTARQKLLTTADTEAYGRDLARGLQAAGLHTDDPETRAQIGVAIAQMRVPSRGLAYHPRIVDDWLQGTLLPTQAEHAALLAYLGKMQVDSLLVDAVDERYENASFGELMATEVSRTLTHLLEESELSADYAAALAGVTRPALHEHLWGKYTPTAKSLSAYAEIFARAECFHQVEHGWLRGKNVPSARTLPWIYDDMLKQRATLLWEEGIQNGEPHVLMQAARLRYNESIENFAAGKVSRVMWMFYERDRGKIGCQALPRSPDKRKAMVEHAVVATERARHAMMEKLHIVPEPWVLAPDMPDCPGTGILGQELPHVREAAQQRAEILMQAMLSQELNLPRMAGRENTSARGSARYHGKGR